MQDLQKLVKKYTLTKSGNKYEVAKRIYSLRSLYLSKENREMLEDFLNIPNNKKEKRIRKNIPK